MSRKTLLTEAEVRQFLKLANIGPVGDAKVQEMYGSRLSAMMKTPSKRAACALGMRDDDEPGDTKMIRDLCAMMNWHA